MREHEPPMTQTMNVTDAREHWSQVLTAVFRRQTRVVLEKAGIPVASLVSTDDLERLRRYDAERAADFAELEREVARVIAEVRTERRARREQAPRRA